MNCLAVSECVHVFVPQIVCVRVCECASVCESFQIEIVCGVSVCVCARVEKVQKIKHLSNRRDESRTTVLVVLVSSCDGSEISDQRTVIINVR